VSRGGSAFARRATSYFYPNFEDISMTERRTVLRDADGVRRTIITDSDDQNKLIIHTEQVLDEILDGIQRDRAFIGRSKDITPVARIPVEIYEAMIREGWGPDDERKWLNSSAAQPFRLWRGTL
jgi:hypothetical protein